MKPETGCGTAVCSYLFIAWMILAPLTEGVASSMATYDEWEGPTGFGQTTRYVNPTGIDAGGCTNPASPCATINYTIGIAGEGDVISLAEGVYTESIETGKSLSMIGQGSMQPGGTIIQAHQEPGISDEIVINLVGENQQFEISNLIIRNGQQGLNFFNTNEELSRSLTVRDAVISNNQGANFGAGMRALNGSVTLENVDFLDNIVFSSAGGTTTGGGLLLTSNSAMGTNLTFRGNKAINGRGGGLALGSMEGIVLEGVIFADNEANIGGALSASSGGSSTLVNVQIINNKSTSTSGGGVFIQASTVNFVNAVFSGNEASTTGGAIFANSFSTFSLVNSVIANNESVGDAGGISIAGGSSATFLNSVLWNNSSGTNNGRNAQVEDASLNGSFSLYGNAVNDLDILPGGTFSCPATTCITVDPEFVDPDSGIYTLSQTSPAIDAGDPDTDLSVFPGGPSSPLDLNGNPRVQGEVIDIGAYESGPQSNEIFADRFEQAD